MNYENFLSAVKCCIMTKMGEGFTIGLNHVTKNNGTELDGITLIQTNYGVSPNIYLNEFYDEHCRGRSIENISEEIIQIYNDSKEENETTDFELEDFFEFEKIKSKIVYRLVNLSKNKKILNQIPFIRFLDLAVVFYCVVRNENSGLGSIRINNDHMNTWGINVRELMKIARENTPRMFPPKISAMEDVISEFFTGELIPQNSNKLYVLSNSNGINGASTLLYADAVRSFSKMLGTDFYVLPSSIHEVILLPFTNYISREKLKETVFDINRTQVLTEEILSNEVYIYRRKSNSLEL